MACIALGKMATSALSRPWCRKPWWWMPKMLLIMRILRAVTGIGCSLMVAVKWIVGDVSLILIWIMVTWVMDCVLLILRITLPLPNGNTERAIVIHLAAIAALWQLPPLHTRWRLSLWVRETMSSAIIMPSREGPMMTICVWFWCLPRSYLKLVYCQRVSTITILLMTGFHSMGDNSLSAMRIIVTIMVGMPKVPFRLMCILATPTNRAITWLLSCGRMMVPRGLT